MRWIAIAVLALALPGCAALQGASKAGTTVDRVVTPANVFALESGYVVVQTAMAAYRSLPYCPQPSGEPCQTKAAARQIKAADASVSEAFKALDTVAATDTTGLSKAYTAASEAVDAATKIAAIYGASD